MWQRKIVNYELFVCMTRHINVAYNYDLAPSFCFLVCYRCQNQSSSDKKFFFFSFTWAKCFYHRVHRKFARVDDALRVFPTRPRAWKFRTLLQQIHFKGLIKRGWEYKWGLRSESLHASSVNSYAPDKRGESSWELTSTDVTQSHPNLLIFFIVNFALFCWACWLPLQSANR